MATYDVNPAGVKKCKELIAKKRYVLDSEWGDAAPDADAENAFLDSTHGTTTAGGTSA